MAERRTRAAARTRTRSVAQPAPQARPVKRSWIRVLLLSLISFGLYGIYWFYVTRTHVDAELGDERVSKQSPAAQTFGPLALILIGIPLCLILIGIPMIIGGAIWYLIVFYRLCKDLETLGSKAGLQVSAPLIFLLQLFVSPVGMVVAQDYLNKYWDKETKGAAVDAPYGAGEIIVSLVGVLFFAAIIGISIIVEVADTADSSYQF